MTKDTTTALAEYGPGKFACAGLVTQKRFLRKTIRQSSNATGVECVTLVEILTNSQLSGSQSFTISGLTGYATASNNNLGISYSKSGLYDRDKTFGEDAVWNQLEGTLVFTVAGSNKVMPKSPLADVNPLGDHFEFSFRLKNGPKPQDAVPVCTCMNVCVCICMCVYVYMCIWRPF
jgi:hypothetical protein